MKTWIITLPFLCAVGVAMAQGVEEEGGADRLEPVVVPAEIATPDEPAAVPADPAAMPDKAQTPVKAKAPLKAKARVKAKGRMSKRGPKTLPRGDVRHCLDLKTRAEIIRCSETGHKK